MLTVVVDAKNFYSKTGVPNYIEGLVRLIHERCTDFHFVLIAQNSYDFGSLSAFCEIRLEKNHLLKMIKPNLWLKFFSHRLVRNGEKFLAGATLSPLLVRPQNVIAVVYDLTHIFASETMTFGNRLMFCLFFKRDVSNAGYRIAISHGTSGRLYERYGITCESVIHPIVSKPGKSDEIWNDEVLNRFGLCKYLLFVGTSEPRKNLRLLVDCYTKMRQNNPDFQLCVVGAKGWGDCNLNGDGIVSLGFVTDLELSALLRRAEVLILPSSYEGFGIPVREALLHGTRVVCSDIPELREAGGKWALYVKGDIDSLLSGIESSINLPKLNVSNESFEVIAQVDELIEALR